MKKILLDTNFLLMPMQFKVDIFSEIDRICHFNYSIFVLDRTIDELKKIMAEQRGKDKNAAKIGLQILKAKKVHVLSTESTKSVDNLIYERALNDAYIVCTSDITLKRQLREKGVPLIVLRQKRYLTIEGKI